MRTRCGVVVVAVLLVVSVAAASPATKAQMEWFVGRSLTVEECKANGFWVQPVQPAPTPPLPLAAAEVVEVGDELLTVGPQLEREWRASLSWDELQWLRWWERWEAAWKAVAAPPRRGAAAGHNLVPARARPNGARRGRLHH